MDEKDLQDRPSQPCDDKEQAPSYSAPHTPHESSIYYAPCKETAVRSGNKLLIVTLAFLLCAVTVLCLAGSYVIADVLISRRGDGQSVVVYQRVDQAPVNLDGAAAVYADVSDTVVEIKCTGNVNDIYGKTVSLTGSGSGVIYASNDTHTYIITNHHVTDGYDRVTVRLSDGRAYEATLVGTDWGTDLALLCIEVGDLHAVCFGSGNVQPGQPVVAIGNPMGTLGGSITDGLVSGPLRKVSVDGISMSLIQSSTPVSPGNSGGGLFNMSGDLLGIVNAKYTATGAEGIGFAIPADKVLEITEALMTEGYVSGRADLGLLYERVLISSSTSGTSYRIYVKENTSHDESKGAAQIRAGDLIVSVNGQSINDISDIYSALADVQADGSQTVTVEVERIEESRGPFAAYPKSYTFEMVCTEYSCDNR